MAFCAPLARAKAFAWLLVLLALAPAHALAQDHGHAPDLSPPSPEPQTTVAPRPTAQPDSRGLRLYETANFRLRTDAKPEYALNLARRLDQYHDKLTRGLRDAFHMGITVPPTSFILFERQEDYQRYANRNAPQLTNNGGYYDGGTKTIVTYRYNNSMQLYFHEIIHAVMGELFNDPFFYRYTRPNWPIWFDEGLAEYYGSFRLDGDDFAIGTVNPGKLAYLVNALETGTFVSLRTLLESPPDRYSGDHMNIYYAASWGLVSFLMQKQEYAERLPLLLARLRNNQDGLVAFRELYGDDLDALDAEWRAWLGRIAAPNARPISLFNGSSIEDWTVHEGGVWSAEAGVIRAEGTSSYNYLIRSELPYQMFTLRCKLKLDRGTAGIILGNNFHGEYPYYYLVDFSHNRVAVRRSFSATHIEVLQSSPVVIVPGAFVDVTIRVAGGRLRIAVDGVQVAELAEDRDRYSLFGLYLYHARASFKDLVLTPEPFRPTGPR